MTDEETPQWSDVTVYLIKADVQEPATVVRAERMTQVRLVPGSNLDAELYFVDPPPDLGQPAWMEPMEAIAEGLPSTSSWGPGAVLVFRAAGRLFALTFGSGHFRLRNESLVEDFGLRVAADWLDPEDVIGVDSRTVEQAVLLTRRNASSGTGVAAMGVEADRDSVYSLTGRPRDPVHGKRVTGRVGAHLTRPVGPQDLLRVARELLDAYNAPTYQTAFPEIDRRREVDDPGLIAELDALMVAGLATPSRGGAYLAPPEIVDWGNVAGFRFNDDYRGQRRVEVTLEDYLAIAGGAVTLNRLHDDHVSLVARDTGRGPRWTVYKSLIAERATDNRTFVLADGRWWQVHEGYIADVTAMAASIPEAQVQLPPYLSIDADEGAYNSRVAPLLGGAMSLDADLATFKGERGRIELCDIAGPGRRLIHVKRGLRAKNLSHLFAQALGSAEALRHMPEARRQLRDRLAGLPDLAAVIEDDAMHAGNWEVVIAIVASSRVPENLPFFSRAHLARTYRALRRLDYSVSYRMIDQPA
jgi:uncharacterized protein (TIGR04141 family)